MRSSTPREHSFTHGLNRSDGEGCYLPPLDTAVASAQMRWNFSVTWEPWQPSRGGSAPVRARWLLGSGGAHKAALHIHVPGWCERKCSTLGKYRGV